MPASSWASHIIKVRIAAHCRALAILCPATSNPGYRPSCRFGQPSIFFERILKVTDCYALTCSRNPAMTSYTCVSLVAAVFVRNMSKLLFLPHYSLNKLHFVPLVAAAFVRSLSKLRLLPHCYAHIPGYRPT